MKIVKTYGDHTLGLGSSVIARTIGRDRQPWMHIRLNATDQFPIKWNSWGGFEIRSDQVH